MPRLGGIEGPKRFYGDKGSHSLRCFPSLRGQRMGKGSDVTTVDYRDYRASCLRMMKGQCQGHVSIGDNERSAHCCARSSLDIHSGSSQAGPSLSYTLYTPQLTLHLPFPFNLYPSLLTTHTSLLRIPRFVPQTFTIGLSLKGHRHSNNLLANDV